MADTIAAVLLLVALICAAAVVRALILAATRNTGRHAQRGEYEPRPIDLCQGCFDDAHCDGTVESCECTCGWDEDWAEEDLQAMPDDLREQPRPGLDIYTDHTVRLAWTPPLSQVVVADITSVGRRKPDGFGERLATDTDVRASALPPGELHPRVIEALRGHTSTEAAVESIVARLVSAEFLRHDTTAEAAGAGSMVMAAVSIDA